MPIKCFEFKILYSSYGEKRQPVRSISQEANTYLSSSIYDLRGIVLTIVFDDPAESILDCGVVAFHKMMFDKTDSERGFAWNSALDHR
jgi:hypothetical protein